MTFEAKFQHFGDLGRFATTLTTTPFVSISLIDWRLTDKTRASLSTEIRRMAIEDAVKKAQDFGNALGRRHIVATEVSSIGGGTYGNPYATASPRIQIRSYRREPQEELNFEPEDVAINCSVEVKFVAE